MKESKDDSEPLSECILELCKKDPDAESLIAPRREKIISLLCGYLDQIELYNPSLSLVGTCGRRELIVRHIIDSLAPLGIIRRKMGKFFGMKEALRFHAADVGSGAGLPGIPLAVALPGAAFSLIERKGRRAGFLRNTVAALGLSNATVEEEEMEKVKPRRFELVTFRAFRPLEPKILKKLFRLCSDGGFLAAYKGRLAKTEGEMAALEAALPDIAGRWELVPCPVPMLDEERHLLLLYSNKPAK
ncbi:MAG: class I SAM-dependent methyltransferase [Treponema sp.]|nr:class I SAM-dependent methyltransferase [Treponema sp.]